MERLSPRTIPVLLSLGLVLALAPSPGPRGLVERLSAGLGFLQAGRAEQALAEFEQALALEPGLDSVRMLAARSALEAGRAIRAAEHLEALGTPLAGRECLEIAISRSLGRLDRAVDQLAQAASLCPDQAAALEAELEPYLVGLGEETALPVLQSMARQRPGWGHLRLGLWLSVRQPEAALSHLALAAELNPAWAEDLRDLIQLIEGARPRNDPAYSLAQVGQFMARSGEWGLAAEALGNAVAVRPDYTEARAYLGLALDQSGRDGLGELQQAAAEAPSAAMAHHLLGKHWRGEGDLVQAIGELELAAGLAPQDPLIAVDLASAYAASGQLVLAKAAYLKAIELAPSEPLYWMALARFSLDYELEVGPLGLPAARRVVALQGDDPEALDRLGYSHYLIGNWDLAERLLTQAIRLEPQLASGYYHLGLLRLVLGDLDAGRQSLQTASALGGEDWVGDLARRSLENLLP